MGTSVATNKEKDRLNPLERAFVLAYVRCNNGKQAAIEAGYSEENADNYASRLLAKPLIRAELAIAQEKERARLERVTGITLENTVVSIARSAFYDVRKLFNADGSPKDITELDDDIAAAIEGIEVVETYVGSGEERQFTGYVKKYKMARRSPAQDMLMKHLNGYKEHEKNAGKGAVDALVALLDGMRRSVLPVVQQVDHDDPL